MSAVRSLSVSALAVVLLSSCGQEAPPQPAAQKPEKSAAKPAANDKQLQTNTPPAPIKPLQPFQPLNTGTTQPGTTQPGTPSATSPGTETVADDQMEQVKEQLQPLQILLGQWEGVTNKPINGSKALTEDAWVWDFQTEPTQPALVMTAGKHPYFKSARLTYLLKQKVFRLTATTAEGQEQVYEGDFSEPVIDTPDEKDKKQRTYKLKLTETAPQAGGEELVFNQQNNNRMLLEISRKRGTGSLLRFDTIGISRKGTSIAQLEDDYGEKECIVSQGLGTMTVSYQGKTYYVCCSGCQAAFNEDPEKWIAKAEARAAAKMKEE